MISAITKEAIRKCLPYISDDRQIAAYVSSTCEPITAVDVERVRRVWNPNLSPNSRKLIPGFNAKPRGEPIGLDHEIRHARMSKDGSERLLAALWKHHPRIMTVLGAVK